MTSGTTPPATGRKAAPVISLLSSSPVLRPRPPTEPSKVPVRDPARDRISLLPPPATNTGRHGPRANASRTFIRLDLSSDPPVLHDEVAARLAATSTRVGAPTCDAPSAEDSVVEPSNSTTNSTDHIIPANGSSTSAAHSSPLPPLSKSLFEPNAFDPIQEDSDDGLFVSHRSTTSNTQPKHTSATQTSLSRPDTQFPSLWNISSSPQRDRDLELPPLPAISAPQTRDSSLLTHTTKTGKTATTTGRSRTKSKPDILEPFPSDDSLHLSDLPRPTTSRRVPHDPIESSQPSPTQSYSTSTTSISRVPPKRTLTRTQSLSSYPYPSQSTSNRRSHTLTRASSSSASTAKTSSKTQKAADKAAERAKAQQQRAVDREYAQALADCNRPRTDKKVATPEMIVVLPDNLPTVVTDLLTPQLRELQVDMESWSCQEPSSDGASVPVIRFKRKVKSQWNGDQSQWIPAPPRVENEEQVIIHITGEVFVQNSFRFPSNEQEPVAFDHEKLDQFVQKVMDEVKSPSSADASTPPSNPDSSWANRSWKFLFLIEGLYTWLKRSKQSRNRHFTQLVRSNSFASSPRNQTGEEAHGESHDTSPPALRGNGRRPAGRGSRRGGSRSVSTSLSTSATRNGESNPSMRSIPDELVEDVLIHLQVMHNVKIHHVQHPSETAMWLVTFTQHIATAPYRQLRDRINDQNASFCMDSGQVRSGDDAADTYIRLLQEISRVSAPIAHGIANRYPNVPQLFRALEKEGPLLLQNVPKTTNKDGMISDKMIGQSVSRRIYKVFTGRDPTSLDV